MRSNKNWTSLAIPKISIYGLMAITGGVVSLPVAAAQQAIEEITVTATRREASLLDVPVSVSVVSGEQIREQSLQNLDDLSNWVPGFNVREGGEQTSISIRGFGAGLNFGFDQSVGLFVDGMYSARERQFRANFLDIENVEVLRGPQATLFGKNTISGAVIIRTGDPTHDFDLKLRGEFSGGARDRQQVEAIVNGSLSETLAGRLAIRASDDNGYTYNTLTNQDEEQQKDWVIRPTFMWTPTEEMSVRLKLEYADYERSGRNFQISDIGGPFSDDTSTSGAQAQLSSYLAYDPDFEYGLNNLTSKQLETADVQSKNAVLEIKYDLGFADFESITGYSSYQSEDQRDVDWSPTTFLIEPISQDFDQVSQEFRLISQSGDKFDYIAGLYFLSNEFYVDRRTDINIETYLLPFGVTPGDEIIFGGPAANWRYSNLRFLNQESDTRSAYFQGTWHLTPRLDVTAGLRYNREDKSAVDKYNLSEFGTDRFLDLVNNQADIDLINGIRTVLGANVNGILANAREGGGDLSETDLSPEITVSFDATDNSLYYVKFTRGHKGGGFNSQTTGQNTDPTFEDETVDGYEIGGKFRLATGYVNLALFRQDFDNLQTSVWTGNEFDVGNAGKARSQGLEVDTRFQLTDRIGINASAVFLDAKYIENSRNACSVPQLSFGAPGCFNDLGEVPGVGTGPFFQDLTGKRFATKLQGNVGIGYAQPLGRNLEMLLRADATYTGDQENPRDPTIGQGALTLLDVSATLRPLDGPWSLALLVKNATDREHWWYEFEAPSQPGTRIGFLAPPRTVTLRIAWDM